MHWAAKKRQLDPWRRSLAAVIGEADISEIRDVACDVQVFLWFQTHHRRDPHNYTGTVVKALVDTMVREGVWPDDTPEWVRVLDPIILLAHEGNRPHFCIIEVTPR